MGQVFDLRGEWPFRPQPRGAPRIPAEELRMRAEALMRAPLLEGLSKRNARAIAKVTGISTYAAGATLIQEGSPGATFYVILEGRARIVRGKRVLTRVGPGDFFGEVSLLAGGMRTASTIAETQVITLELEGKDFRAIMAKEPLIGLRVSQNLARIVLNLQPPPTG